MFASRPPWPVQLATPVATEVAGGTEGNDVTAANQHDSFGLAPETVPCAHVEQDEATG
jgi:hypothetical protein